jgi:PhnB protein
MTQLTAYLTFDGNCREAMTFYKECLGGELMMQTVENSPVAQQMPAEFQKKIMHSRLVKDGIELMASDMSREKVVKGNAFSLCINCSSDEEIQTLFSKLSEDGKVIDPLAPSFWGATFGCLKDKFGTTWLLNYEKK